MANKSEPRDREYEMLYGYREVITRVCAMSWPGGGAARSIVKLGSTHFVFLLRKALSPLTGHFSMY